MTTFLKHDAIDYYPQDGAFIHGLYIEGARWPTGEEAGEPEMMTGTPIAGTLGMPLHLNILCSASTEMFLLMYSGRTFEGAVACSACHLRKSRSCAGNMGALGCRIFAQAGRHLRVSCVHHLFPRTYICLPRHSEDCGSMQQVGADGHSHSHADRLLDFLSGRLI